MTAIINYYQDQVQNHKEENSHHVQVHFALEKLNYGETQCITGPPWSFYASKAMQPSIIAKHYCKKELFLHSVLTFASSYAFDLAFSQKGKISRNFYPKEILRLYNSFLGINGIFNRILGSMHDIVYHSE